MTIDKCKRESAFYTKEAERYGAIKCAIFLAIARKYDKKIIQIILKRKLFTMKKNKIGAGTAD